jgi:hypothetical protein
MQTMQMPDYRILTYMYGGVGGMRKMSITKAYEEVIDFIPAGTTPSGVVSFQPSEAVKARVEDLIHREKSIGLSSAEKSELDHYLQLVGGC